MRLDKFPIDVGAWEKEVKQVVNSDMDKLIEQKIVEIGLPPELENHKLTYQNDKIEFIDKIKSLTALY